jgi:predicted amidohydrolase YtcJ
MPLGKIADSGILCGLGTDATIVSHYSPFVTLGWVVSGLEVGANRVLDETLTREEALIAHTRFERSSVLSGALGSFEVGKQADLVVLDRDYMTVPAAQIKRIRPPLTWWAAEWFTTLRNSCPALCELFRTRSGRHRPAE